VSCDIVMAYFMNRKFKDIMMAFFNVIHCAIMLFQVHRTWMILIYTIYKLLLELTGILYTHNYYLLFIYL
jgi:hypothetical protein